MIHFARPFASAFRSASIKSFDAAGKIFCCYGYSACNKAQGKLSEYGKWQPTPKRLSLCFLSTHPSNVP